MAKVIINYPPTGELDDIQRMAFTQGLDLKLENLGLINVPITMGNDGTKSRNPETKQLLTEVGDNFIKFINKTN
nr:hypothetical protein JUJ52_00510 [Virgibacillus sp. AGTR]